MKSAGMCVLVCGGRNFGDLSLLRTTLDRIHAEHPIAVIIHGGARGADVLARFSAVSNGIEVKVFHADWEKFGRAAGPIRNQQMIDEGKPDLVVAFDGGAGTADMVRRAVKAGIVVRHPQKGKKTEQAIY